MIGQSKYRIFEKRRLVELKIRWDYQRRFEILLVEGQNWIRTKIIDRISKNPLLSRRENYELWKIKENRDGDFSYSKFYELINYDFRLNEKELLLFPEASKLSHSVDKEIADRFDAIFNMDWENLIKYNFIYVGMDFKHIETRIIRDRIANGIKDFIAEINNLSIE